MLHIGPPKSPKRILLNQSGPKDVEIYKKGIEINQVSTDSVSATWPPSWQQKRESNQNQLSSIFHQRPPHRTGRTPWRGSKWFNKLEERKNWKRCPWFFRELISPTSLPLEPICLNSSRAAAAAADLTWIFRRHATVGNFFGLPGTRFVFLQQWVPIATRWWYWSRMIS